MPLRKDVSFRSGNKRGMWKIGDNKTIDEKRIMIIPMIFIPNPTLIKSIIFTLPLENIIALGGVAKNEARDSRKLLYKTRLPIGNIKERETAIQDDKIRRAA